MRKILCLLVLCGAFNASAQRFVRYFDTVTDMAASNPADPNVYVVVGGSVSFNDNQAARWKWVSGSVDPADGNTVVSTWAGGWPGKPAGRWKKINEASGITVDTSGFITNYNVVVVDNKAALQNINVTNNVAMAFVKGKYALNDGWEGPFTFNPVSVMIADDAFNVAPNTGVGMWERQTPNPLREIPATWFDPNLTNGVIQAAINYAASLSTNAVPGREVLLPPKFIELNGNTGLNMSNNVTLVGQNGTVLATSAGTVAGYQMIRANGVTNWGVKNLQLIGLASVGGYGIFVTNSSVGVWGGINFATNFTTAPVWITNSSRIIPFDDKWTVNSVRAYGAGANGRDDTISFQMAFANLDTNSEEIVYAPPGEYYANIIMAKEGAVLRGAGRNLTRLFSYNTNSPTVTMGLDDGEFYRNMRVEHLSIGAPQQTGGIVRPTVCGLRVQGGASKGTVEDVYVGNIQGNLVEILGGTSTFHGMGADVTTAEISFFRIMNSLLEYARGGSCLYMNCGVSNRSTQLYITDSDLFTWNSPGSKMARLEGVVLLIDNSYWQGTGPLGGEDFNILLTNKTSRIVAHNWNVDGPTVAIDYGWDTPQAPYTYLSPQGVGLFGRDIFIGGDIRYSGGAHVNLSPWDVYNSQPISVQQYTMLRHFIGSFSYVGTNFSSAGFTSDRSIYGTGDSNLVIQSGLLTMTTPDLNVSGSMDLGGSLRTAGTIVLTNLSGNTFLNISASNAFKEVQFQTENSNQWSVAVSQGGDLSFQRWNQAVATNLTIYVTNQPVNGDWIAFNTTDGVETRIWTNDTPVPVPFFIRIGTNAHDTAFNLYQYMNTYKLTNNDEGPVRFVSTNDSVMYTSNPGETLTSSNSVGWGYTVVYPTNVVQLVGIPLLIYNSTGEVLMTNQMNHSGGFTRLLNGASKMGINVNNQVGIGTDAVGPEDLAFGGNAVVQSGPVRHNAYLSGVSYTVHGGGSFLTGTNLDGGPLILQGGIPTGTGTNYVAIKAAGPGGTGTTDSANTNIVIVHGGGADVTGRIGLNTVTWTTGSGAPSADAAIGSIYCDTSGGVGSTFYVKEVAGAGAGNWKVK